MASDEQDPFVVLELEEDVDPGDVAGRGPSRGEPAPADASAVVTARLDGFDLEERPLLAGVPGLPGEIVAARSTVPIVRAQRGATVVVAFEDGDRRRPIVLGVLQVPSATRQAGAAPVTVQADDTSLVLSAEREIVLRCGDASITLTRAGKVLIKGTYVLSRSSGYNRIKGAAIDIN